MKAFALMMAAFLLTGPAMAQDEAAMWPGLRDELFDTRPLQEAGALIAIDLPDRTGNDLRTDIAALVKAPPGQLLGRIWVVLDNNPMPVSAVFDLTRPLPQLYFDVAMRVNGQTPVHVVAETTDGQLFVAGHYLKTSGTGACAAPPGTDPEAALATLGQIELTVGRLRLDHGVQVLLPDRDARLDVNIDHPSHSGMQRDQITLLYIPFRYVERLDIELDDKPLMSVTGSISLAENPRLGISIPQATRTVGVTMTDTEGATSTARKDLSGF